MEGSLCSGPAPLCSNPGAVFIYGWMRPIIFKKAGEIVEKRFGGMVVVQEKEIREEDLEGCLWL